MDYKKQNNKSIEEHILDASIHGRGMTVLLENHTYRGNASNVAVDTDILKIHTDGLEATVDHSTGTSPRIVNLVWVVTGGSLVAANTVPEGTLGIIYYA